MKETIIYKILKKLHWKWVYFTSSIAIKLTDPYYDWKYNIDTYKVIKLEKDISSNSDATFYMSIPYIRLFKLFKILNLNKTNTLLDIGSGLGRVVLLSKNYNIKKAIGVELDNSLHKLALINSTKCNIKSSTETQFLNIDAVKYLDNSPDIYIMFNPFGIQTLIHVMENIKKSIEDKPRKIKIVYLSAWQTDCQKYMDNLPWLNKMIVTEKQIPSIFTNNVFFE